MIDIPHLHHNYIKVGDNHFITVRVSGAQGDYGIDRAKFQFKLINLTLIR